MAGARGPGTAGRPPTRLLQRPALPVVPAGASSARGAGACPQRGAASGKGARGAARCSRAGPVACAAAAQMQDAAVAQQPEGGRPFAPALMCAPITADSTLGVLKDIELAASLGADVVELRLDYQADFNLQDPAPQLQQQLDACAAAGLKAIVTFRPAWEGGKFEGVEAARLAILKFACALKPAYVDVELLAADFFFAAGGQVPLETSVILSHHDYQSTPSDEQLDALTAKMFEAGADIAKIASTATDVTDALRMLALPGRAAGPVIALAMGERGLPSRLLASKAGAHLTFGALAAGRGSAPGQPTLAELAQLYRVGQQTRDTQVFGVIGNPVSHSRSPALHNAALRQAGINAVYVPLLVDSLPAFLAAADRPDWCGFSVTIPHKLAALEAADEADPVAARIGAVNTLVRRPGGGLAGHNTDLAALAAIETRLRDHAGADCSPEGCSLDFGDEEPAESPAAAGAESAEDESPLAGQRVVVVGAGGAARALAFGAAARGAHVTIANRSRERAEQLAAALGGGARAASLADVASGAVSGHVLLNTTSVGMAPDDSESPVPKEALAAFRLVFDAVYTPVDTRLLQDARACGCLTVDGLEMFVGQAAQQFRLFTGREAPLETIRQALQQP